MKKKNNNLLIIISVFAVVLILLAVFVLSNSSKEKAIIKTSEGDITVELYPEKAPVTVENFKQYANEDFYDNTVFHRVIEGFMIQGGGFDTTGTQKQTKDPIKLESDNGLSNEKYTIAMARTPAPDSATSQFFINTKDNDFLNYGFRDEGYAVFGKVIDGFEVVDKIKSIETTTKNQMPDWPVEEVIIYSIELK